MKLDLNELEEQKRKFLSFNENESKKALAIKELLKSKLFLTLIIMLIIFTCVDLAFIITNQLSIGNYNVLECLYIVLDALLMNVFPVIFIVIMFRIYFESKKDKKPIISQLIIFRRYTRFYLIVMTIVAISQGVFYINANDVVANYPDYAQLNGITIENANLYVCLGWYNIFAACCYGVLTYSILRTSMIMIQTIILDEVNNKYIDFIILDVLLGIVSILLLIGSILSLCGINSFMSGNLYLDFLPAGILYFIRILLLISLLVLVGILAYRFRQALLDNKGTNSLDDGVVYTIDDLDKKD